MSETRRYTKRRRAAAEEETRRRIVDATVELHRTVGPVKTTISAIAENAGVQRVTVYRHFPEERQLFAACGQAFVASDPPPDPADWAAIGDPAERRRTALRQLYAWYARNEGMVANTQRDAPLIPALAEVADFSPYLEAAARVLLDGRRGKRARAVVGHALAFSTWRSLVRDHGLADREAADLMGDFAE